MISRITTKDYCNNKCKYRNDCKQENCIPECYKCKYMSDNFSKICNKCNGVAYPIIDRCYYKSRFKNKGVDINESYQISEKRKE